MRYVELLGLPGAGKTTMLRRWDRTAGFLTLHQLIRRERLGVAEQHRLAWARLLPKRLKLSLLRGPEPDALDVAAFIVDHPDLHDLVVAQVRRCGVEHRLTALWMLLDAWARYGYARRVGRAGEGIVLDEGIVQRLAFLMAASGRRDGTDVPPLAGLLPQVDGLVFCQAPLELAVARVRARGAEFQATEVMPAMATALHGLMATMQEAGVPLLVVDARGPKADSLDQIRRFLQEEVR